MLYCYDKRTVLMFIKRCKMMPIATVQLDITPEYTPYESLNKKSAEIIGFDADMVKLFEGYLSDMKIKHILEFKQMDFDNIVTQIQGDQIDFGYFWFLVIR